MALGRLVQTTIRVPQPKPGLPAVQARRRARSGAGPAPARSDPFALDAQALSHRSSLLCLPACLSNPEGPGLAVLVDQPRGGPVFSSQLLDV